MRWNPVVLALAAAVVVAVDVGHKAHSLAAAGDAVVLHERSLGYALGVTFAATLWCGALLATRSLGLAVAGGLVLGGALGNVLSWALWPTHDGIPNPLLLGDRELGLAFNVADAAVVVAVLLVLPAGVAVFVARNRERLSQPVRLRG